MGNGPSASPGLAAYTGTEYVEIQIPSAPADAPTQSFSPPSSSQGGPGASPHVTYSVVDFDKTNALGQARNAAANSCFVATVNWKCKSEPEPSLTHTTKMIMKDKVAKCQDKNVQILHHQLMLYNVMQKWSTCSLSFSHFLKNIYV